MSAAGATMQKRSFDQPDETRPAGRAQAQLVTLNGITFMRVTAHPGWRWSEDVKPIVKTGSCQAPHTGLVISGRVRAVMDDGSEEEFGPGDVYHIPPGHDAWVVGDEPYVGLDITGSGEWARAR